jgi:hypothetical protein
MDMQATPQGRKAMELGYKIMHQAEDKDQAMQTLEWLTTPVHIQAAHGTTRALVQARWGLSGSLVWAISNRAEDWIEDIDFNQPQPASYEELLDTISATSRQRLPAVAAGAYHAIGANRGRVMDHLLDWTSQRQRQRAHQYIEMYYEQMGRWFSSSQPRLIDRLPDRVQDRIHALPLGWYVWEGHA